ncbi:MAG: hypothetical protein M1480_00955 [Bacteroidetes bacterium]|nr:hypothetical protein [Bacteroidota bacterium]
MKSILTGLLIALSLFSFACKSNSDNPVSSTDTFSGTFNLSSFTTTGTTYDSLIVSMNLTGNNDILSGTGSITYGKHQAGNDLKIVINGNAAGSYSDSNIGVTITDKVTNNRFIYTGTKTSSSSSYQGSALIITATDTLTFASETVYKSN